jgi:hypothetical protein
VWVTEPFGGVDSVDLEAAALFPTFCMRRSYSPNKTPGDDQVSKKPNLSGSLNRLIASLRALLERGNGCP